MPGDPFHVPVGSVKEAAQVLKLLAEYDLFQLRSGVKPDYSNAQGLEVFVGDDWWEWSDEATGETIEDLMDAA